MVTRRDILSAAKQIAIAARTWPAYGPFPESPYPLAPLHAPLTVMANPPVVTVGAANAASVISGSVLVAHDASVLTYFGTRSGVGAIFPDDGNRSPANIQATDGTKTLYVAGAWGVEFEYDGAELELRVKGTGSGSRYRLTVDGEGYESVAGHAGPTADGNGYNIHYDLGSAASRRLRFDFDGNVKIFGIYREPTATITTTTRPLGPTVVVLGDSFTEGSNADAAFSAFGDMLGQRLGWRDIAMSGWGGTGYVNDNSGAYETFGTRLQKDVIDAAPDVVIVAGGINDHTESQGTIDTAVDGVFDALASGLPAARVFVLSPWWPDGDPPSTVMQTRDTIRAQAVAHGFAFIDTIGGAVPYSGTAADYLNTGWMTGTGYVGNEEDDGNADIYTSSDGTHPTQAGHDYLGYRLAQGVAARAADLIPADTAYPVLPADSGYADVVLATPGLVAYWRLAETTGTVATDASGNGNHGTIAGGPALGYAGLLADDSNKAISLDGSNDTITLATDLFDGSSPWSVECWCRVPSSKASDPAAFGVIENIGGTDNGFFVGWASYQPLQFYRYNSVGNVQGFDVSGYFPSAGTLLHLVATYDGSTVSLYANGALKDDAAVTGSVGPLTEPFAVGSRDGASNFYASVFDEVALYDVALDGSTVSAHYAAGT